MSDIEDDIAAAMQEVSGGTSESAGSGGSDSGTVGAVQGGGDPAAAATSASEQSGDVSEVGETQSAAAKRARDDKGRFAPGSPEAKAAEAAAVEAKKPVVTLKPTLGKPAPTTGMDTHSQGPTPAVVPTETIKAPQSWKPGAREHFAKLPPEVQAEVNRREKEIAAALQESAPARQELGAYKQVMAPFENQIRAEGGDPIATVQSLLRTQHTLRNGTPQAKATMLAQIVRAFDVPIEALDNALAGEVRGQPQHQQQGEFRDPRFDQFMGNLKQAAGQRQQEQTQRLQAEIDDFATKNEFFGDVKGAMSALLAGGVAKDLQEAYDRACWADGGIRSVLQQRELAKAATATSAATQQARSAASSIRSSPASASHAPKSGSVEDDVRASLLELSGR